MTHDTTPRVTARLPQRYIDRADALVESGEYQSRTELVREALRDLFARYEWRYGHPDRQPTQAKPRGNRPVVTIENGDQPTAAAVRAMAYQQAASMPDRTVLVFDEARVYPPDDHLPGNLKVVHDTEALLAELEDHE